MFSSSHSRVAHRVVLAGALVMAASTALAACSSSAPSGNASPNGGTTAASPAATPASAAGGSFYTKVEAADAATLASISTDAALHAKLPASVKSAGSMTVGTQISAPETFDAPETTNLIGDEVTLMKGIAKTLGVTPKFQVVQFDELIPGLQSKRFDLTIGAMNDTKARQATITFVDYFNAGIGMIVKKGNPSNITGPASLCGVTVNAQVGTTQAALAQDQSKKCQADGKKPVTIVFAQTNAQQLAELKSGRVAVYLADTPTAAYVAAQNPDEFAQADASNAIEAAPYGIGFNKSNTALASSVQGALNKMIADGSYGKILDAWGLQSGAITQATINGGK